MIKLFNNDGQVLVSQRKYPHLHRALEAGLKDYRKDRVDWERVSTLRQKGKTETAYRIARRILGVQGPPMTEETKAKLRQYGIDNADAIAERRKQRQLLRKRTKELTKAPKQVKRKR